uniref:Uncharacterized protein n=1 Tax=Anguilla anguilla TaxID=7936 RepID=A0A0E9QG72_ANGAN
MILIGYFFLLTNYYCYLTFVLCTLFS